MKASSDLFELIKSLNKAEKRHFKLYASKHVLGEGNNYVKLFDQISKQSGYDEHKIKTFFKNSSIAVHFAFSKHYLYQSVLDSLHFYHLNLSSESIRLKQFQQAAVLFDKGLFKQSEKLILRISSAAEVREDYQTCMEAMRWQKKLIRATAFKSVNSKMLQDLFKTEKVFIRRHNEITELENLQYKLAFLTIRSGGIVREAKDKRKVEVIMRNSLLRKEIGVTSVTGKALFNTIRGIEKANFRNDFKAAYKYDKRKIELLESKPVLIEASPNIYITGLRNLLIACIQLNRFEDAFIAIRKMRNVSENFSLKLSAQVKASAFVQSFIQELAIYINQRQFQMIDSVINEIEDGLKLYQSKMGKSSEMELYYTLTYLYFEKREFRKSLKWLNKIVNAPDPEVRPDLLYYSKTMSLLIHFELQNNELLPYILKSTLRFLKKHKSVYAEEKIVLGLIRDFPKANSKEKLRSLYTQTKVKMLALKDVPFNGRIDIVRWLESKIS